jgi:hypothetical protein
MRRGWFLRLRPDFEKSVCATVKPRQKPIATFGADCRLLAQCQHGVARKTALEADRERRLVAIHADTRSEAIVPIDDGGRAARHQRHRCNSSTA